MIESKELRIGNLVELHNLTTNISNVSTINTYLHEVTTISVNGCILKALPLNWIGDRLTFVENKTIQPIPLTEEWLLRLGFKKFCKDFSKKGIIIHTRKRGFIIKKSVPQMRYVHQLQNYYFALTDEELTLQQTNN